MKRREFLVMGGIFGTVLAGAWVVGRPPSVAPALPAAPVPSAVPADIARLLEQLKPEAREAYAFALERPDVLQHMPCYCGCGDAHTSNLSCFVKQLPGGGITLDSHGST